MKRFVYILLSISLLLCLTGCSDNTTGAVTLYYLRKEIDFNSPTPLIVEFTQQTNSIPQHYEQIINQYLRGPASAELISPFPAEIQLKAFDISSNQSSITLSYYTKNFSNSRRTIAFACLTKTLVSLTGINAVEIIVEDMDSDAQEIFNFSIDSFLYIDSVSYDEITDK